MSPLALSCRFGKVGSVTVPSPLQFAANSIEHFFNSASGGDLALNLDLSPLNAELFSANEVSTAQLHSALMILLGNSTRPIDNIGIVFADRFKKDKNLLGLMFDVDFKPGGGSDARIPREGCAVFLGKIKERNPNDDATFRAEVAYTAIHELGHVFNLGHLDDPLNFMRTKPPSNLGNNLDFIDAQKNILRQCASEFVRPGGSAYGNLGPLQRVGDFTVQNLRSADAFALELSIDMSQREFWFFEPVELDITLAVAPGVRRPVTIPNFVDPAYEELEIWIEEPDGARRKYRPTKRFCSPASTRTIYPEKALRRDVSIFGGAGGFTFQLAGVHRLQMRLRLPDGGVLESNKLEVNLLPLICDDDRLSSFSRTLTSSENARFLFYRPPLEAAGEVEELREFARKYEGDPCAAGVDYAIGRGLLEAAVEPRSLKREKQLRKRGAEYLQRALHQKQLSTHREELAIELLKSSV